MTRDAPVNYYKDFLRSLTTCRIPRHGSLGLNPPQTDYGILDMDKKLEITVTVSTEERQMIENYLKYKYNINKVLDKTIEAFVKSEVEDALHQIMKIVAP